MIAFVHDTPAQRMSLGAGTAATRVRADLAEFGATRIMIVGGARAESVTAGLDAALVWSEVVQHVPVELAGRARDAAAAAGIDAIVAVGGGSAIGLAKAIALVRDVRIVAVPTTYAGSEATDVWGLTDAAGKRNGSDPRVLPASVVYDPDLVADLPADLAAASGLNAVAHCVDALWGPRADPLNAALATEAMAALRAGLLAPDAARMQYGCYLAAVAFASAGSGLHHKICHVLGGAFGLPHAATHAVVLPYVLAWNGPAAPEATDRIARALDAADATAGLGRLRHEIGAPRSLRELGLDEPDIARAVADVLPAVPASNPRPVDAAALTRIITAAWAGDDPTVLTEEAQP